MEPSRGALTVQRALAALLLAAALGAAAVERGSPLATRIREGRPWPFWLTSAKTPAIHLGVYDPVRRSLVLIRLPEQTRRGSAPTLARALGLAQEKISALTPAPIAWEGAGRLSIDFNAEDDEPAASAARALKARGDSPRALAALASDAARGLSRGDKTAADPLLLALELRRVALERLEPALLPDAAFAPAFLARAFATTAKRADFAAADRSAVVVEVLNGTRRQGLAAQAAKMLRSRGVDVMSLGAAKRSLARTVVYDRTGDFERAALVRAALGCPTAIAATRVDALRGVDVSLELGSDCADAVARAGTD